MLKHKFVDNVKSEDLWDRDIVQFQKDLFDRIDREDFQKGSKGNMLRFFLMVAVMIILVFAIGTFLDANQEKEEVMRFVYEVTNEATDFELNENHYIF